MSDLNLFCVQEPRLSYPNSMINGNYAIVKGAETYTYRNYSSSSCDNSGATFTTPPPSFTDCLSRQVILEVPINIVFTGPGDASDNAMIQSNKDAFRAFPLEQIIKNMQVTINGENLTVNTNQVVNPFSRYYLDPLLLNEGITPNMLDNYQDYSDGDGNAKNPLAWYDNSTQNPRGAYADYEIITNTNSSAEIRATLRTYLMISPFQWLSASENTVPALTQLVSLDWNINFASNLQHIWSRSSSNDVPVTNVQVTIGSLTQGGSGNANLKLLWMTPHQDLRDRIKSLPMLRYPYFTTTRYSTTGNGAIQPNDRDIITSQVINFINLPNAIYIYCSKDESTYVNNLAGNLFTTDTFGSIENIDITMANVTGILSTAFPQQLYDISVKNGLKDTTFNEFIGKTNAFNQLVSTFVASKKVGLTGSCIRLTMQDLSARSGLVAGVQQKIDFQVKVTVRNINQNSPITFQLFILAVFEGYLQIYNGQARTVIGPLSEQDANCSNYVKIDWEDLQSNFGGSKLGDQFKVLGKNISKYAQRAKDVNSYLRDKKLISKGLNVASILPTRFSSDLSKASEYAAKYGYGDGGCECEEGSGGMMFEEQRGDIAMKGGRQMGHMELKKRLKKRR